MAYDKAVDSAVLDAGLKQIADAIREKGGTSDTLAFPNAMAEAIAAISAGEIECEIGTFQLAESAKSHTVTYKNSHSLPPDIVAIFKTATADSTNNYLLQTQLLKRDGNKTFDRWDFGILNDINCWPDYSAQVAAAYTENSFTFRPSMGTLTAVSGYTWIVLWGVLE